MKNDIMSRKLKLTPRDEKPKMKSGGKFETIQRKRDKEAEASNHNQQ
jgi:hypothetical protein